jgi:filamentous hemagglutinin family protein
MSTVAYPPFRPCRHKLLISCATIAIATAALAPQRARAQAFQGTPTTAAGSVTFDRASPGSETVTINSNTATINWAPTDTQGTGTITFLPAGNTATYQGGAGLADFTVLNRIVPTDATRGIQFDGSVFSKLAGGATGGNVWFYSPGGIVVGANAVFDVGGLLLSSIDLPNGFTTSSTGFGAAFSKTQTGAGSIQIKPGAQINARSSYVAMVAPRIEQGGNVQVNGSAAYAAADGLTMTMSQGLFDIEVPFGAGTSDANGIVHSGTTGGTANSSAADHHSIYMVAVNKNQALTMLLDGTIGFAPAATGASVENGQIVLSSGFSINDLSGTPGLSQEPTTNGGLLVGSKGTATFTSDVVGFGSGSMLVDATAGDIEFAGDLTLTRSGPTGLGDLTLTADSGHSLSVGGAVSLSSRTSSGVPSVQISADGGNVSISGSATLTAGAALNGSIGTASLSARNGNLTIGGATSLNASIDHSTGLPATDGDAADVTGGTISVTADAGGRITTGDLTLKADALGQPNEGGGDLSGGDATGGTIHLFANGGGTIQVNGDLDASADGIGGNMMDGSTHGGKGQGGTIAAKPSGTASAIHVTGDFFASSSGSGGSYVGEGVPTFATGGDGRGGFAYFELAGGSLSIGGNLSLEADGSGGDGRDGGQAFGGNAGLFGSGGSADLGPDIFLSASAHGGDASSGFGGNGGFAKGGVTYIQADATLASGETPAVQSTVTGGTADLEVEAWGGHGGAGNGSDIAAGRGGDGQGGVYNGNVASGGAFAIANTAGGTLTLGDTFL